MQCFTGIRMIEVNIAKAIRIVMRSAGIRENKKVQVEID